MRECEELLKCVQRSRDSRLDFAGGSWLQVARLKHTCQACQKLKRHASCSLQDKSLRLARPFAHGLSSQLNLVARSSRQNTLFGKIWLFTFLRTLLYIYPYTHWWSQKGARGGRPPAPPLLVEFSKIFSVKQSLTNMEEKKKKKNGTSTWKWLWHRKKKGKKSSHTPNHAFVLSYVKLASISLFFILYHYLHYFYYLWYFSKHFILEWC